MPRYRYRYQVFPLNSLGVNSQMQINTRGAWRVQFTLNGGQIPFYVNGQTVSGNTIDDMNGQQVGFIQYTVGGVIINGEPVLIDENTLVRARPNRLANGVVVVEWLDPIQ